jgi:hypothetical protein
MICIRWPFLTTQPELVQPFALLSAMTLTDTSTGFDRAGVFDLTGCAGAD